MTKNTSIKRSKTFTLAIVAMFMLTSFAGITVSSGSDAVQDTTYTVNLYTGAEYSYTPSVNLTTGTIRYDITNANTDVNVTGSGTNKATVSFSAPSSQKTDYSEIVIKAIWTAEEDSEFTQEAYQRILFKVYDRPQFLIGGTPVADNTRQYTLLQNTPLNTQFGAVSIGGEGTEIKSATVTLKSTGATSSNMIKATISEDRTSVAFTTISSDLAKGTYSITVEGESKISSGTNANEISYPITFTADVTVTDAASISPTSFFTYYGQDDDPNTPGAQAVRTIYATPEEELSDIAITISDSSSTNVIPNAVLSDPSKIVFNTTGLEPTGQYQNVTFKMNLEAKDSQGQTVTVQKSATLKMYASLAFMSDPSAAKIMTVTKTGNNMRNVTASIGDVVGATRISYNWGDGSPAEEKSINSIVASTQTGTHLYERDGVYTITAIISNDYPGSTPVIRTVTYDTYQGAAKTAVIKQEIKTNDDGVEVLELDGTTEDAVSYEWYKGSETEPFCTTAKAEIPTSELKNGQEITLIVTDANGIEIGATYTFDESILDKSKSFWDEHGWIWILAFALSAILALAYFRWGFEHPVVVIASVICLLVGIYCFVAGVGF